LLSFSSPAHLGEVPLHETMQAMNLANCPWNSAALSCLRARTLDHLQTVEALETNFVRQVRAVSELISWSMTKSPGHLLAAAAAAEALRLAFPSQVRAVSELASCSVAKSLGHLLVAGALEMVSVPQIPAVSELTSCHTLRDSGPLQAMAA
jgi:hypothetical protein